MRLGVPWRGLARLRRCRRGSAAVELALVLPLLATLLMSGMEYVRFLILNQKLERASAMVADVLSQAQIGLTLREIDAVFGAVDQMLEPFELSADGSVIVTSVSGEGAVARVQWQERYGHGSDHSAIGAKGETASLPYGLTLRDGENVLLAEVYFTYAPMLLEHVLADARLYRVAAYRPRFGPLDQDPRG
jgi:Flp pilus assembly protein TadG